MKARFLLLCVLFSSPLVAEVVELRNDTPSARVMEARGVATVVAVEVPPGGVVAVEVGALPLSFDLQAAAVGIGAGFASIVPFLAVGFIRRMFQEAD
jgi:hypothetical protein